MPASPLIDIAPLAKLCRSWSSAAGELASDLETYDPGISNGDAVLARDFVKIYLAQKEFLVAMIRLTQGTPDEIEERVRCLEDMLEPTFLARVSGGDGNFFRQALPSLETMVEAFRRNRDGFAAGGIQACVDAIGDRPEKLQGALAAFKGKFPTGRKVVDRHLH